MDEGYNAESPIRKVNLFHYKTRVAKMMEKRPQTIGEVKELHYNSGVSISSLCKRYALSYANIRRILDYNEDLPHQLL